MTLMTHDQRHHHDEDDGDETRMANATAIQQ